MDSSVSPKGEIWFLRMCRHISNAVYHVRTTARDQRQNGVALNAWHQPEPPLSHTVKFQSEFCRNSVPDWYECRTIFDHLVEHKKAVFDVHSITAATIIM